MVSEIWDTCLSTYAIKLLAFIAPAYIGLSVYGESDFRIHVLLKKITFKDVATPGVFT